MATTHLLVPCKLYTAVVEAREYWQLSVTVEWEWKKPNLVPQIDKENKLIPLRNNNFITISLSYCSVGQKKW